ncbi:uncharacterized protein LOC105907193 [Clupea harengus]|uniref:Uncharacterized protein LOC105907193 n=1 Tax=Clupea harengus TaxID=7950 RepID=A0A6P3W6Y2_CLUHA|nr:uncharacterized protein LOC105907193 [Clupea harengus]
MEDETGTAPAAESNLNPTPASTEAGPLVQVTFQKDPNRKTKYLEAEPKALGCTQILLAVFLINFGLINYGLINEELRIAEIVNGIFPIIAGSVAIAAQNLKLPILRSCLVLQVFSCISCSITFLFTISDFLSRKIYDHGCAYFEEENNGTYVGLCRMLAGAEEHYSAEAIVVLVTLIAISATLAAYCCKVIQCCSPVSHMPVITVNAPPASE